MLQGEFKIFGFLKGGWDEVINLGLALACLAGSAWALSRHRDRAGIEARVIRLARVLAPALLLGLVILVVQGRAPRATGEDPRHVVVVVLDAWPADYLHTFNPGAPERGVDSLFARGRVYRAMHTNATWTHGYFGALYLGSTTSMYSGRAALHHVGWGGGAHAWDLWSGLEREGVTTRWVVFHQNGIPESRALSDYRGLRSIHFTQRFAPLFDALGLDYHLVMCGPASRKMAVSPRRRALFGPLNAGADVEDALNDVLLPQMRSLQRRTDRSFLLFHTGWTAGRVTLPVAWEESAPLTERERLVAAIKKNDNRYGTEDEWYAAELREKTKLYTGVLCQRIERLFARLEDEGLLDHATIIFTADHGHMFDRGRFWYGFHPDEEVARVPFVVFAPGVTGVDDAPRETIDITRTIMEAFGGSVPNPRAVSVLEPAEKAFTVTLTQPSPRHHEWFVALYAGGRKVVCNVAAGGDGACVEMDAAGRNTLRTDPGVRDAFRGALRDALVEIGLPSRELHPAYQALLAGSPGPPPAGARPAAGATQPR